VERRIFLEALSAGIVMDDDVESIQINETRDNTKMLPNFKSEKKSEGWIKQQFRDEYGSDFYKPPGRGIYFHYTDNKFWVAPRDVIVPRAKVVSSTLREYEAVDKWDCEDQALELRHRMTASFQQLTTGVMFNSGTHVYNVFITSEGDVIEFEPRNGQIVTDSTHELYNVSNGILLF